MLLANYSTFLIYTRLTLTYRFHFGNSRVFLVQKYRLNFSVTVSPTWNLMLKHTYMLKLCLSSSASCSSIRTPFIGFVCGHCQTAGWRLALIVHLKRRSDDAWEAVMEMHVAFNMLVHCSKSTSVTILTMITKYRRVLWGIIYQCPQMCLTVQSPGISRRVKYKLEYFVPLAFTI